MIAVGIGVLEEKLNEYSGFIPEGFLHDLPEGKYLVYISTCWDKKLVFMEPSPEQFTGFTFEEIRAGGLDLQVSRIHPEDLQGVYEKVARYLKKSADRARKNLTPIPLNIEYRIRGGDNKWMDVQETRIHCYYSDGTPDVVIGKIINVTQRRHWERLATQKFMEDPKHHYPILHSLQKYKQGMQKQPIHPNTEMSAVVPPGIGLLTKREKEILQMIADGLSTKQIASNLAISINTVQSHRNHLLQKLQVKNSMELVRQAAKAFWL